MEILFGTKVRCAGGETAGEVVRVIVETRTTEATHIVIARGPLLAKDWLVPLSMVEGVTNDGLQLLATCDQLPQLPQYIPSTLLEKEAETLPGGAQETERAAKPAGAESQAVTLRRVSVELGKDCQVMATDGALGPLAGVRLELYTNALSSAIVSAGAQFNRAVNVPAPWIGEIGAKAIKLATTTEAAAQLVGPEAGPYLAVEGKQEDGGAQ